MDDKVIPITVCSVAWQQYLTTIAEWLGQPPSRGLDVCPSKLSNFARYTASLGEFEAQQELDPKRTLRKTEGPWLRHTFYSFLILTSEETILKMAETTDLDIISVKAEEGRVAVVSGTLDTWHRAVILMCREIVPRRSRLLFNVIKGMFDNIGLRDIWFDYRESGILDGTFLLEYKQ